MKSAIEAYKEAYELDYRKGDWEEAEYLYRDIIEKYPHSEEKEYAEVHLERIRQLKAAGGEDAQLTPSSSPASGGGSAFGIVAFILCLLLAGAAGYYYYAHTMLKARLAGQSALIRGLNASQRGQSKNAEFAFQQATMLSPKDEVGHRLLIDLYLQDGQTNLAEKALAKWKIATPYSQSIPTYERRIQRADEASK